jgi:hypothetical protein
MSSEAISLPKMKRNEKVITTKKLNTMIDVV